MPTPSIRAVRTEIKYDTIALWVLYGTIAVTVGTAVVVRAQGQSYPSPEVVMDRLINTQKSESDRLATLEVMNIPVRLALLEKNAADIADLRKWVYGILAAVMAGLTAQVISIRGFRQARKVEKEEQEQV